ncbi:MAG: hypothetical protein LQ349_009283, partial [Xanthoria aureola]
MLEAPPGSLPPAKKEALLNGPAGKPPAGLQSNLDNPATLDGTIIAVLTLCLVVSTTFIHVRSYTKKYLIKSVALEDYIIVIAWIGNVGFVVPSIYCFLVGGGRHMWDIRLKGFFDLLYWLNISGILYGIIVTLIKVSILLQYLRIFVPHRKGNLPLFVAIHVVMSCIILIYSVETIFMIIMCLPREKIWNKLEPGGHCFNAHVAYMATGIFNVLSDFAILILPMVPIWKLQLPMRKKIMMLAVFATGFCACITSIVRTYYTSESEIGDVSYKLIIMGLWTWAELTAGILVSCLPVVPRFFQHIGPKVYASFKSNSITGSFLSITSRRTRTGIKNDDDFNDSSGRPLKEHSLESDTFDRWDQSVVQTSVRGGKKDSSHEHGRSLSDIRVERSIMVKEGSKGTREDVETGR